MIFVFSGLGRWHLTSPTDFFRLFSYRFKVGFIKVSGDLVVAMILHWVH